MATDLHRQCLLKNLSEHYFHEMERDNHTYTFIKDTLMYGCDETPLDEYDTETLEEMWREILEEVGEDYPEDSDWANGPSEYDLGIGEEFPDEG